MTATASIFSANATTPPAAQRRRQGALVLLTVLAAHWGVLQSLPGGALGQWTGSPEPFRFQTRSIVDALNDSAPAVDIAAMRERTPRVEPASATPPLANATVDKAKTATKIIANDAPVVSPVTVPAPEMAAPADAAAPKTEPVEPTAAVQDAQPDAAADAALITARTDNTARATDVPPNPTPEPPQGGGDARPLYAISGANLAAKPASSRHLNYDVSGQVKGTNYSANGDLYWEVNGSDYNAKLVYTILKIFRVTQTSQGKIGPNGLMPVRFSDKRGPSSEKAAHFQADKQLITFSNNNPDQPLMAGAQDELSVALQVGAILNANPSKLPAGTEVNVQVASTSGAGVWKLLSEGKETLTLAGNAVDTVKFSRAPRDKFDSKVEVWLSPNLGYLPVRIRLSQANGDYVDQRYIPPSP